MLVAYQSDDLQVYDSILDLSYLAVGWVSFKLPLSD